MKESPDPKVFRKAAELIASDREIFACNAIAELTDSDCSVEQTFFAKHFKPYGNSYVYWTTDSGFSPRIEKGRFVRWFALLLCAEMIESEKKELTKSKK